MGEGEEGEASLDFLEGKPDIHPRQLQLRDALPSFPGASALMLPHKMEAQRWAALG